AFGARGHVRAEKVGVALGVRVHETAVQLEQLLLVGRALRGGRGRHNPPSQPPASCSEQWKWTIFHSPSSRSQISVVPATIVAVPIGPKSALKSRRYVTMAMSPFTWICSSR